MQYYYAIFSLNIGHSPVIIFILVQYMLVQVAGNKEWYNNAKHGMGCSLYWQVIVHLGWGLLRVILSPFSGESLFPNFEGRTQHLFPSTTLRRRRQFVPTAPEWFSFDEEFPTPFSSLRLPRLLPFARHRPSAGTQHLATIQGWSGYKSCGRLPLFQAQVWPPPTTRLPMAFWTCLTQKGRQLSLKGSTGRSKACISNSLASAKLQIGDQAPRMTSK